MMRTQLGRVSRLVAVTAIVAVAVSGCARGGGEESGADDTDAAIKTSPGFDGETISLGVITVTSGPLAPAVAPSLAAATAWADYVNANGGIGGYNVELNVTDSAYNPAQALQQYERVKGDVAMFVNIFGTPIAKTLVPKLETDQILAGIGSGDGSLLRVREAIIYTPSESQVIEAIDYNLKNGPLGDDAVFCSAALEGPLAESAASSLEYAKDEMGITVGTSVSVAQATTDATPQVLQLQDANCDVVIVLGVNAGTVALVSAASKLGYEPLFTATAAGFVPVKEDDPIYDYVERNLTIVADVVPFGDDSAEGMPALVEAHDKYASDVPPSIPFVVSWTSMLAMQSVLEEAIKRGDLSHEGLVEASNALSTFDMKGIGPVWGWGEPDKRTAPETYNVYKPDATEPTGMAIVETNLQAPDAAINYPY